MIQRPQSLSLIPHVAGAPHTWRNFLETSVLVPGVRWRSTTKIRIFALVLFFAIAVLIMWSLYLVLLASPALAQIRVLFQNDLSFNATAAAIFLATPTTGSNASSACTVYNEQQLSTVSSDIQDQLNYLVFRGDLSNASQIHVGGNAASTLRFGKRQSICNVYRVGTSDFTTVNCSTMLVSPFSPHPPSDKLRMLSI